MIYTFTRRDDAVMADHAVFNNPRVIKCPAHKSARTDMTNRTILRGRQVIRILTCTDHAIVTRGTIINDTGMIKDASRKSARGVANTTILGGGHMI